MKKRGIVAVAGLAAIALVGGTFAYFTQTTTIDNPFNTATYKTTVTEQFNPSDGDKWEPGAEVNKDLYVSNSGDRDVVVRVKFEEEWSRKMAAQVAPGVDPDKYTMSEVIKSNNAEVTVPKQGEEPTYQENPDDGLIENDGTVVEKFFAEGSVGGTWSDRQPDGYYYFLAKLAPAESTGKLLDKVKLAADADMGKFWTHVYYKIGAKDEDPNFNLTDGLWKEYLKDNIWPKEGKISEITALSLEDLKGQEGFDADTITEKYLLDSKQSIYTAMDVAADKDALGYSSADYVLSITVDTVQATDQAVIATFGEPGSGYSKDIFDGWDLDKEALE